MAKISLYSITLALMGLMSLSSARPIRNYAGGNDGKEIESSDGGKSGEKRGHQKSSVSASGSGVATASDIPTVTSIVAEGGVSSTSFECDDIPAAVSILSCRVIDNSSSSPSLSDGREASTGTTPSRTEPIPGGGSSGSFTPSPGAIPSNGVEGDSGDLGSNAPAGPPDSRSGGYLSANPAASPAPSEDAGDRSFASASLTAGSNAPDGSAASSPSSPRASSSPTDGPMGGSSSSHDSKDDTSSKGGSSFYGSKGDSSSMGSMVNSSSHGSKGGSSSAKRVASSATGGKSGKATWYNPGLGSCGETDSDSDLVVALATGVMFGGKNCGKNIKITDSKTGKSATAKVHDSCPSCAPGDLDMSPSLFQKFQSLDIGTFNVKWNFE